MPHFILGTDESCLMASDGGKVKVFGDKGKRKHEKILADSRVSITILRTAATGGATGPTQFLLEGAKVKTRITASLAEISALTKANKHKEKCKADTELLDLAPASLQKLLGEKLKGDVTKLTKKEICAISFRHFGTMYKEANPKPVLVSGLEGLIAAQPLVLPAAAAAGAPAAAPVATAAAADGDSEDEYEEEEE